MVAPQVDKDGKYRLELMRVPSEFELTTIGEEYNDFYKWRNFRTGMLTQFQKYDFETVLTMSRELFWNAATTPSEDLRNLGLEFSLPYVRNETLQFVSKIVSQNFKGRMNGNGLDIYGVKVLQGMWDKWRFKSNDKVEKFWEVLYGVVNGTVCNFIGYNNGKLTRRYLESYDKKSGAYNIREKEEPYWNDVWSELVPIEDMYLPKIYERDFQKQGRVKWKTEMDWNQFKSEFKSYDNAEYVYPGNMIAEDSLYYRLLSGTGVMVTDKIQILKGYDWVTDSYKITANGVLLNPVGKGRHQTSSPMPWKHKMGPFSWGIFAPLDEKLAYGLPLPFLIKEPHKLMNVGNVMLWEHELRNVSPAILSSDFDAPKIIYGRHDVIPVNDVASYKEFKLTDPSTAFFNTLGQMQSYMSTTAQGGQAPALPSRQPKSARESLQMQQLAQQAQGITLILYYNILRQQMLLVLKTALQFYPVEKYAKENRAILRTINVPNMSLTSGGVGNMEIRVVKARGKDFDHKQHNLELFFEALQKSMLNGKMTEIIEAPEDVIQNLEFEITDIDMEPEQTDEMRKQTFVEQVLTPMFNVYIPAGLADPAKVMLRHLEKLGESPMDFVSEKVLAQVMSTWGDQNSFKMPPPTTGSATNPAGPQAGNGQQTGNVAQINTGTKFGANNAQPIPA